MASHLATLCEDLSAPGLIRIVREQFSKITDTRRQGSIRFTQLDTLCEAPAMCQFKWPSLLQFDESSHGNQTIIGNLRRLYWLDEVASDSQLRDILDPIKPSELRKAFRAIHSSAQRGKVLEDFAILDNRYLLAIDQLYSNRPFVVLEDALPANGPRIQALICYDMDFIINIKPVGNASLFEVINTRFLLGEVTEGEETLADGSGRGYRFTTDLPLHASHPDTRVNMIEYWEVDKHDTEKVILSMSWRITNLEITGQNIFDLVRAARTRWKVGRARARSNRLLPSPLLSEPDVRLSTQVRRTAIATSSCPDV